MWVIAFSFLGAILHWVYSRGKDRKENEQLKEANQQLRLRYDGASAALIAKERRCRELEEMVADLDPGRLLDGLFGTEATHNVD